MFFFSVAIKDIGNPQTTHSIRNLCIDFRDLRKDGFLLSLTVLPPVLAAAVAETSSNLSDITSSHSDSASSILGFNNISLVFIVFLGDCLWYRSYRDAFLYWAEPAEHEYLRHYIACILVVSTSHADPLEELSRLSQSQNGLQVSICDCDYSFVCICSMSDKARVLTIVQDQPIRRQLVGFYRTFSNNMYYCMTYRRAMIVGSFVLLFFRIVIVVSFSAEELYQSMKVTYGANCCHLLRINSIHKATAPVKWTTIHCLIHMASVYRTKVLRYRTRIAYCHNECVSESKTNRSCNDRCAVNCDSDDWIDNRKWRRT